MQKIIDLRSDTVTQPTRAMREAMLEAEVGDDVYGEDPTVKRLEAMAAERLGKESGLFVVSGTMGNLVSLLAHCKPGDSAVVGSEAHIVHHELWSQTGFGQITLLKAENDSRGGLDSKEVQGLIQEGPPDGPRTGVVCLENTHNRCSGAAITASASHAV